MTPRLADLLSWASDRWEAPPLRVHSHEVWADAEGGSILGAPAWSPQYRRWLEDSPFAVVGESQIGVRCIHPRQSEKDRKRGLRCEDCDGTDLRDQYSLRFRWPMRRALAIISRYSVPEDRPRFDAVIWQLAANEWQVALAAAVLSDRFPQMAAPDIAAGWTLTALSRCRAVYREEAPGREVKDKSESQSIAEAAA